MPTLPIKVAKSIALLRDPISSTTKVEETPSWSKLSVKVSPQVLGICTSVVLRGVLSTKVSDCEVVVRLTVRVSVTAAPSFENL